MVVALVMRILLKQSYIVSTLLLCFSLVVVVRCRNPDAPTMESDRSHKRSTQSQPTESESTALRIHPIVFFDTANQPRETFGFGEAIVIQATFTGFALTSTHKADLTVDLAIAGPDGGVYLAKKNAAHLIEPIHSNTKSPTTYFLIETPLRLPEIAPSGTYRFVIKAFDRIASKESVVEKTFAIVGNAPKTLKNLTVEELLIYAPNQQKPDTSHTFTRGERYTLIAYIGGARYRSEKKHHYQTDIVGSLKLRSLTNATVDNIKEAFRLKQEFTYQPLRLLLNSTWTVPRSAKPGLYDLEITLLNRVDDRVSSLRRRIELK